MKYVAIHILTPKERFLIKTYIRYVINSLFIKLIKILFNEKYNNVLKESLEMNALYFIHLQLSNHGIFSELAELQILLAKACSCDFARFPIIAISVLLLLISCNGNLIEI